MRRTWWGSLIFAAIFSLNACVTTTVPVATPASDYSKVKQIAVAAFRGPGGQAATDEFVRQLLGTGIEVTDGHHPGKVMLEGVVTDNKVSNQLMVFLGGDNPIVLPSSQASPE